ncbi:cell wall-binding repeat-containing protein [Catenulispora yoronensis]|uniref:cell wall-binding repeat-containing protein n=1 Tax=Catenulispora yoronensis TaxID=450799 RepID=UPI0031D0FBE3
MPAQRLSAMAVGALALLGAVPYAAVSAHAAVPNDADTELIIDSSSANGVTHGVSGVWPGSLQTVLIGGRPDLIEFDVSHIPTAGTPLTLMSLVTAPAGQELTVGRTYSTTDSPAPTANFTGYSTCYSSTFRFDELTFTEGRVTNAQIEFSANCGGPLHGLLRYHATVPLPAGAPTGVQLTGAPGVPVGSVAPISFKRGDALVSNPGSGVDGAVVAKEPAEDYRSPVQTWSPLGNRLFYYNDKGLYAARPDGSEPVLVRNGGLSEIPPEAAISPDGSTVVVADPFVSVYPTDGSAATSNADFQIQIQVPELTATLSDRIQFEHPRFLPDGSLLLTVAHSTGDHPSPDRSLYRYANGAAKRLIADANWGTPSPDGSRIAFVRTDSAGVHQLFVVGADGTSGLTQLTHGADDVSEPSWSPDGKLLAYSDAAYREVVEINAATGAPVGSIPNATSPVWTPPIIDSHVIREWGSDRVSTAVAASQLNFAAHGDAGDPRRVTAGAVVLSRSDTFADALGGSALAVRKNAPLLITDPARLDPAVKAEIGRVLAPGGTVYLLGGTAALSPAVASALSAYHVVRLSGETRYDTAVQIAKQISPNPRTVMVASGDNYPDALAAGAVGEPVLLTSGATMPKETAAYLNALNPDRSAANGTAIVTIGGPGDTALVAAYKGGKLPKWPSTVTRTKLAGNDRYATALMVAQTFFTSNTDVALATGGTWPDALSGGAMVGHRGGPLLLTDPAGISPALLSYLRSQSASLFALHLLGGPAALPNTIANQAAGVIGVPGHVVIDGFTPGGKYPFAAKTPDAADTERPGPSTHAVPMTQ